MKSEQEDNLELKRESKNEFKNSKLINDYINNFIEFYKIKSDEIVTPLLNNDSLKFFDMQVKKEKKLSNSIDRLNKNDRNSFKKIIKNYLNSNFYYISQKYLIYRFISDFSEQYEDELEKKMNDIVASNLEKMANKKLIKKTFDKIFKAFRQSVYQNFKNGKIYKEDNNNGLNVIHDISINNHNNINDNNYDISLDTKNEKKNDLDCPYPSFDKKY